MMTRITLILGILATLATLLGGVQWALHEWRKWRQARKATWLGVLVLCLCPPLAQAQLWAPVLHPSRAADWTATGVTGGIPFRTVQCGATLNPGVTAAQISDALLACSNTGATGGVYVQLGAGTFTLTDAIRFLGSNPASYYPAQYVTLRGMGPNLTTLVFTALTTNCGIGGLLCVSDRNMSAAQCTAQGAAQNTANWTAGYSPGTTQITLSNVTGNNPTGGLAAPNLVAGMYVILDQANDPNANAAAYLPIVTDSATVVNSGCNIGRSGRCLAEFHQVVAVSGSGPYTVTLTPPLAYPNWQSGQTPQAWWCDSLPEMALSDGVEDLTIDNQLPGTTAGYGLIAFFGAYQSWAKNVRLLHQPQATVLVELSANIELRDSYTYGTNNANTCGSAGTQYGIDLAYSGLVRVENNIFQQACTPILAQPCFVCVYGYNFTVGDIGVSNGPTMFSGAYVAHVGGTHHLLLEGNEVNQLYVDHPNAHGTSALFLTAFRNRIPGTQPGKTPGDPVNHYGSNRFDSFVGNVLGAPATFTYYESSLNVPGRVYGDSATYSLGWSGDATPNDPQSLNSFLRWGNFDYVTNTVRWCGNSSSTGWATTCASTTEIPAGSGAYPQFVPATETLPASFYLPAKPLWFGPIAWPVMGPEVTGGTDASGHAKNNPAKVCYLTVMGGPVDGSGTVLPFSASGCYPFQGTDVTPPAVPTGLTIFELGGLLAGLLWHSRTWLLSGVLLMVSGVSTLALALPQATRTATVQLKQAGATVLLAVLPKKGSR